MPLQEFLTKKRTIEFKYLHLIVLLLSALFIAYIFWEVYWCIEVGLAFIKWHTHIVVTTFLVLFFWLPFYFVQRLYPTTLTKNALLAATSVGFTLVILEILLIITGLNQEYFEQRSGYYHSPYKHDIHNVYHVVPPYTLVTNHSPEFSHLIPHNFLGYADSDWSENTNDDSIRILTLGDSFTEGDGAPYDSSYPAILEKHLKHQYPMVNVMNAGTRGSDPFYNYRNLSQRLLKYKPDIVLQTISTHDIYFDFAIRGGFERFVSDSILRYKKPPFWEPVFAASYIARFFMKRAGLNISNPSGPRNSEKMIAGKNAMLEDIIQHYDSLAAIYHFKVVYILLPMKEEMSDNQFLFNFSPFIARVRKTRNATVFSLLPAYNKYLKRTGIQCEDTYWYVDGHHNATGYNMMAVSIEEYLKNKVLDAYTTDTTITGLKKQP